VGRGGVMDLGVWDETMRAPSWMERARFMVISQETFPSPSLGESVRE